MDDAELNVFLIEDSALLRDQLIETLNEVEGVRVIGHADEESKAIEALADLPTHVAIVDLELKSGSGIGVLLAMQKEPARFHHATPVVLTTHSNAMVRRTCERLGARAFFDKAMQLDDLIAFVEAARKGGKAGGRPGA